MFANSLNCLCRERVLSNDNSICTPLRNRLTQVAVDNIMRICSEGPKELTDTDLEELVNIFRDRENRHIVV
jgi:hypothetical protein